MPSTVLSTLGYVFIPCLHVYLVSHISNPIYKCNIAWGFTRSIADMLSLMCHTHLPLELDTMPPLGLCTHIKQSVLPITGNSLTLLTHLYEM